MYNSADLSAAPFEVIYKESKDISDIIDLEDNAVYIKIMQWNNTNDLTPVKGAQKVVK